MIWRDRVPRRLIGRHPRTASFAKHLLLLACLALLILLSAQVEVAVARYSQTRTPVYSVGRIRAVLTQDPKAWIGRTVLVRGILQGPFVFCGATRPCPPAVLGLIDGENESVAPDQLLPVAAGSPVPLWAVLRRVPLAGTLLPAPQQMRFGLMTTYQLRLRAAPALCGGNTGLLCYEGVVVDAAWPSS
ncbi:MAG TPA: hypothetical protein VHB98_00250 [Chloroflexota bacterium]|nr:hypothetical protein [Chloroflexota bacterium]